MCCGCLEKTLVNKHWHDVVIWGGILILDEIIIRVNRDLE